MYLTPFIYLFIYDATLKSLFFSEIIISDLILLLFCVYTVGYILFYILLICNYVQMIVFSLIDFYAKGESLFPWLYLNIAMFFLFLR